MHAVHSVLLTPTHHLLQHLLVSMCILTRWVQLHRPCNEVLKLKNGFQVAPDCSDYDEAQAWPLLLDNYVEYRQKHQAGL